MLVQPLTNLLCSAGSFVESASVAFDTATAAAAAAAATTAAAETVAAVDDAARDAPVAGSAIDDGRVEGNGQESEDVDIDEDAAAVVAAAGTAAVVLRRSRSGGKGGEVGTPVWSGHPPPPCQATLGTRLLELQANVDSDVSNAQAASDAEVEALGQRATRVLASIDAGMYHPNPDPLDPYTYVSAPPTH